MKLHLPKGLRAAVFACFAAFAGVGTTISSATIVGGVFAVTMAGQTMAADYTSDTTIETALGSEDVTINGCTVTVTYGGGTGFTTGTVNVGAKGVLCLNGSDSVGYNNGKTTEIILTGADADNVATLNLGSRQTMSTKITLNGNAVVVDGAEEAAEGRGSINPFGGVITANNKNNVISSGITLRQNLEFAVSENSTLDVTGQIWQRVDQIDEAGTFSKTGTGKLTIGAIAEGALTDTGTAWSWSSWSWEDVCAALNVLKGFDVKKGEVVINRDMTISNLSVAKDATFTNNGALTLGGTVSLGSAIAMGTNATLTLSDGVIFDLSNAEKTETEAGLVYTLFTGSTADLSTLTADNLTGYEGHGTWTFGKGTLTFVAALGVTWGDGAITWAVGESFGEGVYTDGLIVEFTGEATVTLGSNVKPAVLSAMSATNVTINDSAAADGYTISADSVESAGLLVINVATTAANVVVAEGGSVAALGGITAGEVVNDGTFVAGGVSTVTTYSTASAGTIKVADGGTLTIDNTNDYQNAALFTLLSLADASEEGYNGTVVLEGNMTTSGNFSATATVKGNYKVNGGVEINAWSDRKLTIDSTGSLEVSGDLQMLSHQSLTVNGAVKAANIYIGNSATGDDYHGELYLNDGGSIETALLTLQHVNSSAPSTFKMTGGTLTLTDSLVVAEPNSVVSITGGTLKGTWTSAANMTVGDVTVGEGAAITLSGKLTAEANTQLAVAGDGKLIIANGATLALANAISVGAKAAVTLASGVTLDLSNWTAATNDDGDTYYSILTGEGDNLNISSLTGIKVTGVETHGGIWEFGTDGTLTLKTADAVSWAKGDLAWAVGATFDNSVPYADGHVVQFTGDSSADGVDAAAVTLGGDVKPAGIQVSDDAAVTISNADGNNYSIAANYVDNAGELTLNVATTVESVSNTGTLKAISGLSGVSTVHNDGILTVTGDLAVADAVSNTGALTVNGALTATTSLTTSGRVTTTGKLTTGALTIEEGATLTAAGFAVDSVTNGGTLKVTENATLATYSPTTSTAVLDIAAGKEVVFTDNSSYTPKNGNGYNFGVFLTCAAGEGTAVLKGHGGLDITWGEGSYTAFDITGNYRVDGNVEFNNGYTELMMTIGSGSSLVVAGDGSNKTRDDLGVGSLWLKTKTGITVAGGTLSVAGNVGLGHQETGEFQGTLVITDGTVAVGGVRVLNNQAANKLSLEGGKLIIGSGGVTDDKTDADMHVYLSGGTLGASASAMEIGLATSIGTLTVDTSQYTVSGKDVTATETGSTITLSGALTGGTASALTLTGAGTLALTNGTALELGAGLDTSAGGTLSIASALTLGGTVKLGSAIETVSGGSIVLSKGTTLDLSALEAVNGVYTLVTGAGSTNLSNINLDDITIAGVDNVDAYDWSFGDGTLTATLADMVKWSGGDFPWTAASQFDDDLPAKATTAVNFIASKTASVVTMGEDVTVGSVQIADGATVTLGGDYKLTATNGIALAGDLTVTSDVLAAASVLTGEGNFSINGTSVDYTTQLSGFAGAVTVENQGALSLSGSIGAKSVTLNDGTINLSNTTLSATTSVVMAGAGTIASTGVLADDTHPATISAASISGEGDLTLNGDTSTLLLSGNIAHKGNTILKGKIDAGYWLNDDVQGVAKLANDGNVTIEKDATLEMKMGSVIANTGDLKVDGKLSVWGGSTLGNSGTVVVSGTLDLNRSNNSNNVEADAIFSTGKLSITTGGTVNSNVSALTLTSLALDGGTLNLKNAITGGENFTLSIANEGKIVVSATDLASWTRGEGSTNEADNGLRSSVYTLVSGLSGTAPTPAESWRVYVGDVDYALRLSDDNSAIIFTQSGDGVYYVTTGKVAYSTIKGTEGATSIALNGGTLTLAETDTIEKGMTLLKASALEMAGQSIAAASITNAGAYALALSGDGTYVVTTAGQLSGLSTNADAWTGTVTLDGSAAVIETGLYLNVLGNANSTVAISGVKGYIDATGGQETTYAADIVLTNVGESDALELNNGSTGSTTTFSGTVSGTGDITRTSANGNEHSFKFTCDVSCWNGSFSLGEKSGVTNVIFSGSSTEINAALGSASANALKVTVTNDDAVAVNGLISGNTTLTLEGEGTKTLSAANTATGALTVSGGTAVIASGAAWAGSASVAKGATLYLQGSFADSITSSGTVQLGDGTSITGLDGGALEVDSGTATITGAVNVTSLTNNGTLSMSGQTLTIGSACTTGGLVTADTVTLGGDSTFGMLNVATLTSGESKVTITGNAQSTIKALDATAVLEMQGGITYLGTGSGTTSVASLAISEGSSVVVSNSALSVSGDISTATQGANTASGSRLGLTVTNAIDVTGSVDLDANLVSDYGAISVGGTTKVTGYVTAKGNISFGGAATIGGDLTVGGTLTLGGTLNAESGTVSGITTIEVVKSDALGTTTTPMLSATTFTVGNVLNFSIAKGALPVLASVDEAALVYTLIDATSIKNANGATVAEADLAALLNLSVKADGEEAALADNVTELRDGAMLYTLDVSGTSITLTAKFDGNTWNPLGDNDASVDVAVLSNGASLAPENGVFQTTSNLVLNGGGTGEGTGTTGTVNVATGGVTLASLTVSSADAATAYTYTLDANDADTTLAVTNDIKVQSGTVAIGDANAADGALAVTADGVMVGVDSAATLTVNTDGSVTVAKNAQVGANGTLNVAGGDLTVTGNLEVATGGQLAVTKGGDLKVEGTFSAAGTDLAGVGAVSLGDGSTVGDITGADAAKSSVTATSGTVTVGDVSNVAELATTGTGTQLNVNSVAGAVSYSVAEGTTITVGENASEITDLTVAGLTGTGALNALNSNVIMTAQSTTGASLTAASVAIEVDAVGSKFSGITTGALTLDVSALATTDVLLTVGADGLSTGATTYDLSPGVVLTLTNGFMSELGEQKAEDADLSYAKSFLAADGSVLNNGNFTLISAVDGGTLDVAIDAEVLADIQQYFALAGLDATLTETTTALTLTLALATDREWESTNENTAGKLDLTPTRDPLAVAVYDRYNTVQNVTVAGDYDFNLVGADMTAATDTELGMTIRDLSGTGNVSFTGDGVDADLATLINSEATQLAGDLTVQNMTVQVQAASEADSLQVAQLNVVGGKVDVQSGKLTADALNGTSGTIAGTINVIGQGGDYSGSYDGATVVLAAGASQTLTPGAGLSLNATTGSTAILNVDKGASMATLTTDAATVTLNNENGANTLTVAAGSTMAGGTLNLTVDVQEIADGKAPTVFSGLTMDGTTVVLTQSDPSVTSAAINLSNGTEDVTLVTLTDGTTTGVVVDASGSDFISRYYKNLEVKDGAIVGDIFTDYYSSQLGETENGTAGLGMLDIADLQLNPQSGDLADVMSSLDDYAAAGDASGADRLAASFAGSGVASLGMALSSDVERQLKAIRNRTTTMGVDPNVVNEDMPYFNAWVNAEGDHRSLDQDGTLAGYTLTSWGGTVGFDMDVNPNLTWGLALTAMYADYTSESFDTVDGDLHTYYVSAFARATAGAWVHTFVMTGGKSWVDVNRTVRHSSGSYTTNGDADGYSIGALYEVARTFALNEDATACWQPVFNVAYRHMEIKGYSETGSDAALRMGDQTLDTVTLGLGGRLQAVVGENIYNRTSIFEGRALVKFDVGDRESEMETALLSAPNATSTVKSAEMDAFGVELGAGLTIPMGQEGGSIFLDGSVEFRGSYTSANGTVGYRINF